MILRCFVQEVGWTHMRVLEGVGTLVQLAGLIARLCKMVRPFFYYNDQPKLTKDSCDLQNMKPELFKI
jgi:hypothetical protein